MVTPNSRQNPWGACASANLVDSVFTKASSNHPGGVNVLLTDGSVRFVKDSISLTTWQALGSMAGGEVVSSDSY